MAVMMREDGGMTEAMLELAGREERVRADHACACATCDASLAVRTIRQPNVDGSHVSVRFWDDQSEDSARQRRGDILLDGTPVDGAFEAVLGEQGVVWAYRKVPDGMHRCLRCADRARAAGQITQDGHVRVGRSENGLITHTAISLCTAKLMGRVELRQRIQGDQT